MQGFWIKTVSILLIAGVLLGYNTKLEMRDKENEIAKLQAEVESLQLVVDAQEEIKEAEETGAYKDGIYTGTASGFGGEISVEVTVEEHKITNVEVTAAAGEDGSFLSMAKNVIPKIIEEQSADVDTISGATFSSTGIRDAVREALEKAVQ